jgi:hypothetical protein
MDAYQTLVYPGGGCSTLLFRVIEGLSLGMVVKGTFERCHLSFPSTLCVMLCIVLFCLFRAKCMLLTVRFAIGFEYDFTRT